MTIWYFVKDLLLQGGRMTRFQDLYPKNIKSKQRQEKRSRLRLKIKKNKHLKI